MITDTLLTSHRFRIPSLSRGKFTHAHTFFLFRSFYIDVRRRACKTVSLSSFSLPSFAALLSTFIPELSSPFPFPPPSPSFCPNWTSTHPKTRTTPTYVPEVPRRLRPPSAKQSKRYDTHRRRSFPPSAIDCPPRPRCAPNE